MFIARAVCLLLSKVGVHDGFVTWGSVSWLLPLLGPHLFFEGEDEDPIFMLTASGYRKGTLSMIPPLARQGDSHYRDVIFLTIESISLWFLWKAPCSHILRSVCPDIVDTLTKIWLEIVYSLRINSSKILEGGGGS